jgi:23S rRNA (cytidine1920-2'-O)/16S rRNA (cytidine1409-2'-O)-methyltransferase
VKPFREVVEGLKREQLRGSVKLRAALERFAVSAEGRTCLDVGSSTGGFVTVLLERGATRVFAVDAGHGQLLGSLRQDPRVVNLENTNIAEARIDEPLDLVTVDVSYLSLAAAVAQLDRFEFRPGAELVGLVKPMFELKLARAPSDRRSLAEALARATAGIEAAGWSVVRTMDSPVTGAGGARELFVHASRPGAGRAPFSPERPGR